MTKDLGNPARIDGSTPQGELVAAHWTRLSLTVQGAMQALQSKGIAPGQATASDLHSMDMLHMGGFSATDTLAEVAGIRPGGQVLDVGAGVGGPARRIAHKYGAKVWGVELGESIHQTAEALTALVGLQGQVQFQRASALALHEIFAGEGGPPLFPLAWATDPAISALETLDACEKRLARLGLKAGEFLDRSEEGRHDHLANSEAMQAALAQAQGTQGRSVEATRARLETATSMTASRRLMPDGTR